MVVRIKCTIILTVFNRTQYVEDALESITNQDFDKNLIEVLIISNIGLTLKKKFNLDIRIIESKNMTLGGKLAEGISMAKNDVVTFLEDDDLFCRERISNVMRNFSTHPYLSYYHNASYHFHNTYELKRILNRQIKNNSRKQAKLIKFSDEEQLITYEKYFDKKRSDFNLSSMAFRKNFIETYVDIISNAGMTRYLDSLLFFIAIFRGNSVMIDDKNLTLTRVHSQNASQFVEKNNKTITRSKYSDDMEKIVKILSSINIISTALIQRWLNVRSLDDLMKSKSISRKLVLIKLFNLFKLYKFDFIRSDVCKKGITYVISPTLMYKMLIIYHST